MRSVADVLKLMFILGVAVVLAGLYVKDWIASSTIVGCFAVSEKFQDQCRMDQLFRQRERDRQFPDAKTDEQH